MKTTVFGVLVLALVSISSAFAGGDNAAHRVTYRCDSGLVVLAQYQGEQATLRLRGRVYTLRNAISASGARYVGGGLTWWTKGNAASLFRGEDLQTSVLQTNCLGR